ncbi:MAG: exonuclease SbcCD subunit D, partial [SAR202 cluster bacterium]|nr:exonuclease SbcCD subunit D [SAR202 cluster bacterium]
MRILHFADVHIGVENYSKVDPETGLSSRLGDFLQTFDQMVDDAVESKIDLALFCGDAYKSRDPSQTHQREFAKRIVRLSNAGIPTFLLVGNHDTPNALGRATSLDIYKTLDVAMVTIGDTPRTYTVDTPSGPVQIVAVPWVRRSQFLAREESRRLTPDQINENIQESLTRIIQNNVEALNPTIPAVLAGHVTVGQATTSSEQSMMLGRDHVLLKSAVTLPQLDYVALGHIHKHQILGSLPHVVYAGSQQRIDFGEENDDKGYCVVDLDPTAPQGTRMTKFEFRQVEPR